MEFRGLGLLGVVLLSFACVAFAKDKDVKGPRGISLKVQGKSGRITLIRAFNVTKKKTNETIVREKRITFIMDAIKEVDKDGKPVGARGKNKHSFNGFAKQDFTFSDLVETKFQNLSVHQFNFTATDIGGTGGTLTVQMYLFDEDGEINIGNETGEVKKGSFKFSIKIEGWTFCGDGDEECKIGKGQDTETGNEIDFVLTIQSKRGKRKEDGQRKCSKSGERKCSKRFETGDGDYLDLSQKVWVDGKWIDMAEGYPKFEPEEKKNSITIRFPKFNNTVLYDPTMTLGDTPPPEEPAEKPNGANHFAISIAALILSAVIGYFHT